MTAATKTRRSAAGRKKSPGRSRRGAPLDDAGDAPSLADFLKESDEPPEKTDKASTDRRDALSAYMDRIGPISEVLPAKREHEMAVVIRSGIEASVKALKKALPEAEKFRDWRPSRRTAKTPEKVARAKALLARFNPVHLSGKELMEHVDRSSTGDLGLAMLEWHDPTAYRVAADFIHANLRMVIHLARRFAYHGYMPLEDLIQEGNAGLIIAVLRYDPSRGFRFSTYGTWWIRHALGRAMADKGRTIRLPVHMIDFSAQVNRARRELIDRLERLPTDDELSEATGYPKKKLELLRGGLYEPVSLDEPIDDESGNTLGSIMTEETPAISEWATVIPEKEMRFLLEAIGELSPVMQSVLRLRFGFDDEGERTLREIGEMHDLSRERIRQIQEDSLKKLRLNLSKRFAAAI